MIDVTKYSTADLERFKLAPRSETEALAILHELQDRRSGRKDTGTLSLFSSSNRKSPIANRQCAEQEHD